MEGMFWLCGREYRYGYGRAGEKGCEKGTGVGILHTPGGVDVQATTLVDEVYLDYP